MNISEDILSDGAMVAGELLPRVRLLALELHSESAQVVLGQIGSVDWLLLLARVALQCPLMRMWIVEICERSVPSTAVDRSSDEAVLLYTKCLRVLVGQNLLRHHNQISFNIGTLIPLLSHSNEMVVYQVKSLIASCLHLPLEYYQIAQQVESSALDYSAAILEDILLETAIGGRCPSKSVDLLQRVEERLASCVLAVMNWDCDKERLSRSVCCIGNVVLPVRLEEPQYALEATRNDMDKIARSSTVVETDSTLRNLHSLVCAILSEQPVLVQGAPGSGKSMLIKELAHRTGHHQELLILYISDQTDSKALLGAYTCTDVPGEFVWIPGAITNAVMHGHWLVIEDIDKVPLDFVALFAPLFESRRLQVPALGVDITAHTNFRVFATRSTPQSATSLPLFPGEQDVSVSVRSSYIHQMHHFSHGWLSMNLEAPSAEETRAIVLRAHPKLPSPLLDRLLASLHRLGGVNLRELLLIARRLEAYVDEYRNATGYLPDQLRQRAMTELLDVVLAKARTEDAFLFALAKLASEWDMSLEDAQALLVQSSPQIDYHPRAEGSYEVSVGRARLSTQISSPLEVSQGSSFAQTSYVRRLLEKLAVCVQMNEPVILVGETGNGKTTNVQELARLVGRKLVVQNLSLSSDLTDLLGGYRPVTIRQLFKPVYEQFVTLFQETLSAAKNSEYLQKVAQFFYEERWSKLLKAVDKAGASAITKLESALRSSSRQQAGGIQQKLDEWREYQSTVQRYLNNLQRIQTGFAFSFLRGYLLEAYQKGYWILLDEINLASAETLQGLAGFLDTTQTSMVMEDGSVTRSVRAVHRHPDFRIFAAMNPPTDICKKELPPAVRSRFTELYIPELVDPQDLMHIVASYFGGISDAPVMTIVQVYLGCRAAAEERLTDGSGQKPRYSLRSLTRSLRCALRFMDINIRPLGRCLFEGFLLNFHVMLSEASQPFMFNYLKSQLYPEGDKKDLSFPPQRPRDKSVDKDSWMLIKPFWMRSGSLQPVDWAVRNEAGVTRFVMTESVAKNIRCIAAAVACQAGSILLQGPTSIGKTSMVQYVAARLGKKCVRINNHEHTDVQEYIGGYVTELDGRLSFRDGILVEALRGGYWIILDELNLAPSDVLEALNRLLDDNQELLIPETGELVRPSEGFQLFATQNPPGVYGGRKPLSLAFRNRFVEVNLSDLPAKEVEEIITQSCGIAPKFSAMMVKVMEELQMRRQNSAMLLGKHGVVTVRDLIKWGRRQPQSQVEVAQTGYMILGEKLRTPEEQALVQEILLRVCKAKDFEKQLYNLPLAGTGMTSTACLLLAQERVRTHAFSLDGVKGVAITEPLTRMWALLSHAMAYSEPVLMVGETGCGKTMVCQLYAAFKGQRLRILNCHQSTETADLIGGLRPLRGREDIRAAVLRAIQGAVECGVVAQYPDELGDSAISQCALEETLSDSVLSSVVRALLKVLEALPVESALQSGRVALRTHLADMEVQWGRWKALFEWIDGPLIEAMKNGDIFLIDEINLAEDAVIERLNSVLEFHREITLAEKGGMSTESLVAHPDFRIIATMNPSGDFGKRELSPALRSRFSELWIPASNSYADFALIVSEILGSQQIEKSRLVDAMMCFMKWFNQYMASLLITNVIMTARELIAWAEFINSGNAKTESESSCAVVHGAFLILLDGLSIGHSIPKDQVRQIKRESLLFLLGLFPPALAEEIRRSVEFLVFPTPACTVSPRLVDGKYVLGDYSIPLGLAPVSSIREDGGRAGLVYATNAPSTVLNMGRIMRAMRIKRPILLEGPPGVGKTSIISHLAKATGHTLIRINLSEHTELADLLGSDLPCNVQSEDVDAGPSFKWFDGILLKAMKEGSWVLLDELNLAPQTVLEGLNACFDHREQVFLPEIGKTVRCAPSFRVFSAQNPMAEGGGRKGLPASFLSRFTRVYMESMTEEDIVDILQFAYGDLLPSLSLPAHLSPRFFEAIVSFISKINNDVTVEGRYGRHGAPWEFNLRDMMRWCEFIRFALAHPLVPSPTSWEMIRMAAFFLFVLRMRTPEDRDQVCRTFLAVFGVDLAISPPPTRWKRVCAFWAEKTVSPTLRCPQLHYHERSVERRLPQFMGTEVNLEPLAWCVALQWPVLLVGPCGAAKRSTIEQLAATTGNRLRYFSAIPSLDTSELLGAFEQTDKERSIRSLLECAKEALAQMDFECCFVQREGNREEGAMDSSDQSLLEQLHDLHETVHRYSMSRTGLQDLLGAELSELVSKMHKTAAAVHFRSVSSRDACAEHLKELSRRWADLSSVLENSMRESFAWLNGVVVDSMEKGHWLVFDNVNLCSSSVLDRLNSMLEPRGELTLNEDGSGRVIRRHDSFRIFFVMDPALGEVSRAMRNRCVELYFDKPQTSNVMGQTLVQIATLDNVLDVAQCVGQVVALHQSYFPSQVTYYDALHFQRVVRRILFQSAMQRLPACSQGQDTHSDAFHPFVVAASHDLISNLHVAIAMLLYCPSVVRGSVGFVMDCSVEQISRSFGSSLRELCVKHNGVVSKHVRAVQNGSCTLSTTEERIFALSALAISTATQEEHPFAEAVLGCLLEEQDALAYRQLVQYMHSLTRDGRLRGNLASPSSVSRFLALWCFNRGHAILQHHQSVSTHSLHSLSREVHLRIVCPDSRDILLLGCLWPILSSCESLLIASTAWIAGTDVASSSPLDALETLLQDALNKFDMLVVQLQQHLVTAEDSIHIPWQSILIAVRWLQKSTHALVERCQEQGSQLADSTQFSEVKVAFDGLYGQFKHLWRGGGGTAALQKMTLWKHAGHAHVVREAAMWDILDALERVLDPLVIEMPAFTDSNCSSGGSGAAGGGRLMLSPGQLRRSAVNSQTLEDWLGVYATFFWRCTNEVRSDLRKRLNNGTSSASDSPSLPALFAKLMEPISALLSPQQQEQEVSFEVSEERLSMTENENHAMEALLSSQTIATIKAELKERQWVALRWYSDYIVLQGHEMLQQALAEAAHCPQLLVTRLSDLLSVTKFTLSVGLCFSTLRPTLFRPWKTMLWLLEYLQTLTEDQRRDLPWADVTSLIRSLLACISSQSFGVAAFNLANHVQALDMAYSSPTLSAAMGEGEGSSSFNKAGELSSQPSSNGRDLANFTGWARLHQGCALSFANRHVDLQLLFPAEKSLQLLHPRGSVQASVSIAGHQRARNSLALALQGSLCKNYFAHLTSSSLGGIERSRCKQLLLDTIQFSKQLFRTEAHAGIDRLPAGSSIEELASQVKELDLARWTLEDSSSEILRRCLEPAVSLLLGGAQLTEQLGKFYHQVVDSYSTICFATLQAHLLLANTPIDPAMKPFFKHQLLQSVIKHMTRDMETSLGIRAVAGSSLIEAKDVGNMVLVAHYECLDQRYVLTAIERRTDAPQFVELYNALLGLLQGPLALTSIMALANSLLQQALQPARTDRLHTCQQEELNMQSMLLQSSESLQRSFRAFDDITSSFRSCIKEISKGMRILSSVAHSLTTNASARSSETSQIGSASSTWKELLLTLHNTSVDNMVDRDAWLRVQKSAMRNLASKNGALLQSMCRQLEQSAAMASGSSSEGVSVQGSSAASAAQRVNLQGLLQFVALNKVSLLVESSVVDVDDIRSLVDEVSRDFALQYLSMKAEDKERKAEASSLYVRKKPSQPVSAVVADLLSAGLNTDAEEEEEYRRNFPEHNLDLQDLVDEEPRENGIAGSNHQATEDRVGRLQLLEDSSTLLQIISMTASATLLQHGHLHFRGSTAAGSTASRELAVLRAQGEHHHRYSILLGKSFGDFANTLIANYGEVLQHQELLVYSHMILQLQAQETNDSAQTGSDSPKCDRDLLLLMDACGRYRNGGDRGGLFAGTDYNPPSFHFDSNASEVVAANGPLNQVLNRALTLLQIFPNNDVLMRIIRLTYTISNFHVTVPLGKIASSIQILLKHIHQYEETAHRQISFSEEIASLSTILKRYRALELQSWNHLLRGKEVDYARQAMNFWFSLMSMFKFEPRQLYRKWNSIPLVDTTAQRPGWKRLASLAPGWLCVAQAAQDGEVSAKLEDMNAFLAEKVKILDSFLSESSVGEFAMRLHLVRLLALSLHADHSQLPETRAGKHVFAHRYERVIFGVWRYYAQYLPMVRQFQSLLADPLQRQVKNEIKMNKWDNITIVAMLENSEKINRKLNKFLKQYTMDVLDFPLKRLIYRENMKDIISDSGELVASPSVPSHAMIFPHASSSAAAQANHSQRVATLIAASKACLQSSTFSARLLSGSSAQWLDQQALDYVKRLPKLAAKAKRYLEGAFAEVSSEDLQENPYEFRNVCVGWNSSVILEELSTGIFDRIQSLRGESVNKQLKQKAFRDLLTTLKEQGFAHLRSEVPTSELANNVELLSSGSVLARLLAGCLQDASKNEDPTHDLDRAEEYTVRCMTELSQLRVQCTGLHHSDVSRAEALHMRTFSESMMAQALRMRAVIEAGILSMEQHCKVEGELDSHVRHITEALQSSSSPASVQQVQALCKDNQHSLRIVLYMLLEVQRILQAAGQVQLESIGGSTRAIPIALPPNRCIDLARQLDEVCSQLNTCFVNGMMTGKDAGSDDTLARLATAPDLDFDQQREVCSASWARAQSTCMESVLPRLRDIFAVLAPSLGSEHLQRILDILEHALRRNTQLPTCASEDSASIDAVLRTLNHLLGRSLVAVQHVSSLRDWLCAAKPASSPFHGCFNEVLLEGGQSLDAQNVSAVALTNWSLAALAYSNLDDVTEAGTKVCKALRSLTIAQVSADRLQIVQAVAREVVEVIRMLRKAFLVMVDQAVVAFRSQAKLSYICMRVFRVLLAKGYCDNESKEGEDTGEGGGTGPSQWEDDVDGTGMGEGEGRKDVSDQITNEEQLLDLKESLGKDEQESSRPEKRSEEKLSAEEQDTGVEMEQDFEGDMHDLEDRPEDDRRDDDESDDDEQSIDREMGNDQPMNMDEVVAEKAWNSDDEDEDGPQGDEKFERGNAMEGEQLEEMHTREDDEGDDDKGKDKDKDAGAPQQRDKPRMDQGEEDDNENGGDDDAVNEDLEDNYMDKPQGADIQKEKDAAAGEDGDEGDEGDGDDEDGADGEDGRQDGEGEGEDAEEEDGAMGEEGGDAGENAASNPEEPEQPDPDGADLPEDMHIADHEANIDEGEADQPPDNLQQPEMAAEDVPEESPPQPNEEGPGSMEEEEPHGVQEASKAKPLTYGVQGEGKDNIVGSEPNEESERDQSANDQDNNRDGAASGERQGQSQSQPSRGQESQARQEGGEGQADQSSRSERSGVRDAPNPFTHRGDLEKEWFRRLNIVPPSGEEEMEDGEEEEDEALEGGEEKSGGEGVFEFHQRGADQVLGAVDAQEAMQLPDENELPHDQENDSQQSRERKRDLPEEKEGDDPAHQRKKRARPSEHNAQDNSMDVAEEANEAAGEEDDEDEGSSAEGESLSEEDEANMEDQEMRTPLAPVTHTRQDFAFAARQASEETVTEAEDESPLEVVNAEHGVLSRAAQEAWQQCVNSTDSHAMRLCEQLRLILEPTLASRLQGDYRTGKRINMRRVISYIASGYRKDKIWLRRTKLAKRAYQVMLLIDDSKSMRGAGQLAMQSLALLSTALSRLEVGELCVASFAEEVRVLHSFQDTFTAQSGAQIMSQFAFEANVTRLNDSLRACSSIFERAREASFASHQGSSQAVLQLCFVVSDARIDSDNRVRLEQAVRQMSEKHILVVLVIIDHHENSRDSIFNTRSVSFVDNKVVTTNYLDNFPFPFYVVIQELQRLPEVLADALKQWFELIKAQLSSA